MMPMPEPLSIEVRALLDQEAPIPAVAPAVRARAMGRAQVAVVAREERLFVSTRSAPHTRWAAAAALVIVTAVAAGAAAYAIRARLAVPLDRLPAAAAPRPIAAAPRARASTRTLATPVEEAQEEAQSVSPGSDPGVAAARLPRADAVRAELRLLRRARAAVGQEDFAAALVPIAEHTRRFPDGRLAEEREALRVKALAGLGRTAEAQRAAGAFNARFPSSVLSPAVSKMPSSRP